MKKETGASLRRRIGKMDKQEQIKKRVVRFIAGIAFAAVFLIFAIISISVAPHTSDLTDYVPSQNYHRGVERVVKTPAPDDTPDYSGNSAYAMTPAPELQAPQEQTVEEQPPEEISQENSLPQVDINSWELILVNQDSTIGADYAPPQMAYLNMTADEDDIQYDYNDQRCPVDSRIAQDLLDFAKGCKAAGLPVYLSSGYRGYNEQYNLYQNKISQYNSDVARYIVAEPGTSEHQTGLCCDITDRYYQLKDASLENTETFQWLAAHCADYGFVLRYPKDKSGNSDDLYTVGDTVTKVIYEPWHFRYVGKEAARYMTDNNLCLEEFVALYQ